MDGRLRAVKIAKTVLFYTFSAHKMFSIPCPVKMGVFPAHKTLKNSHFNELFCEKMRLTVRKSCREVSKTLFL